MNLFNKNQVLEFTKKELARLVYEFPSDLAEVYNSTINWLIGLPDLDNFDNRGPSDLNNTNFSEQRAKLNTAREFSYLLPSHTLKSYKLLLEAVNDDPSFLCQFNYWFVDVGCGGGSSSIALIMLLLNYQKFRYEKNYCVLPIQVNLMGIDPNMFALHIYEFFFKKSIDALDANFIYLNYEVFHGKLEEKLQNLNAVFSAEKTIPSLFLSFSNIIRPLVDLQKEKQDFLEIVTSYFQRKDKKKIIRLGEEQISSIENILVSQLQIEKIYVFFVNSPAKKHKQEEKKYLNEIRLLQKNINDSLKEICTPHIFSEVETKEITGLGPEENYFRKRRNDHTPFTKSDCSWGYSSYITKSYSTDKLFLEFSSLKNLELAWARVRNHLLTESACDVVEIKTFEANIEDRIALLQAKIYAFGWNYFKVGHPIHYYIPKGEDKEPRPLMLCHIEEQILAAALMHICRKEYKQISAKSFAYALDEHTSEYIYESWQTAYYNKFLKKISRDLQKFSGVNILQTDLTSFYTTVNQSVLLDTLIQTLKIYDSKVREIAKLLVNRECNELKDSTGIPQGHIFSGFLANIYLTSIDDFFKSKESFVLEAYRYVDDFVFIISDDVSREEFLSKLDEKLEEFHLVRSKSKTSDLLTKSEYEEIKQSVPILDALSKTYNMLLSDLYKLKGQNLREFNKTRWDFTEYYYRLLCSVGIFIPIPNLFRKLYTNRKWWRFAYPGDFIFPNSEVILSDELKEENITWVKSVNPSWFKAKDSLQNALSTLAISSYKIIETSVDEIEKKRALQCLKFSIFRLGILGFENEKLLSLLETIIKKSPYLVNMKVLCTQLGMQKKCDLLINVLNYINGLPSTKTNSYLKGCVIKGLRYCIEDADFYLGLLKASAGKPNEIFFILMITEQLLLLKKIKVFSSYEVDIFKLPLSLIRNFLFLADIKLHQLYIDRIKSDEILLETHQILKTDLNLDFIHYQPPSNLEKYFAKKYPDDGEDFPEPPSYI